MNKLIICLFVLLYGCNECKQYSTVETVLTVQSNRAAVRYDNGVYDIVEYGPRVKGQNIQIGSQVCTGY